MQTFNIQHSTPNHEVLERGIYAASAWPCKHTLKRAEARAPEFERLMLNVEC